MTGATTPTTDPAPTEPASGHTTVNIGQFEFERGGSVDMDVAYETYGDPSNPPVLVAHALTGSQYVAGSAPDSLGAQAEAWWNDVVGQGRPVDTREFYVISANVPGSCYGTTGPASEGPDGDPYGPDFPAVTVTDWVHAQARLLDHLGIDTLYAVLGGSVGGMNAIEWAKQYPERVERVAAIATGARVDAQTLALDSVARRAITADDDFDGGNYYGGEHPDDGLATARRIGHVQYLSKDSMDDRFGRRTAQRAISSLDDPTADAFPYRDVASYLDYNAERFTTRFDANSYLYLLRAMDEYDLAHGVGTDAAALADFDGEALVVSYTGDWHFTVEQGETLATAFERAGAAVSHRVVNSDYGHDAFLVEPETVGAPLRAFLDGGADGADFAPVHASLFS
ncbi:homoserine O-acetyltransferase [Halanaeroarchaeum sp. HSR-CO]|uniref:homoserine O-acetyltransferase MetX n=1 Tax=Halanaeroarchaeum sp. HSR-CO TaxID=2866382 RepID=UPI00217EB57A|nr:homoserine O-acetyltransferase [Halanaeroarchaeum sp. HSR-CO]